MDKDVVSGENAEIFRQEFVRVRHRTGLSQMDFAPYLGICPDYVQKIETGERVPGRDVVLAFFKVIDDAARERLLNRLQPPLGKPLPLPFHPPVSDAESRHETCISRHF